MTDTPRPTNSDWHHHPDLPIPVLPILSWPPRPLAWLRWIAGYWLVIGSVILALSARLRGT